MKITLDEILRKRRYYIEVKDNKGNEKLFECLTISVRNGSEEVLVKFINSNGVAEAKQVKMTDVIVERFTRR